MTPAQRNRIFETVLRVMAEESKVGVKMLRNRERGSRRVSDVRYAAIALCRELTGASMPELGRFFLRDHTTVLHGLNTLDLRMTPELNGIYEVARGRVLVEMDTPTADEWIALVPFRHREVC